MSPKYKPPCEPSNSCLLLSQSSSFTLLTPHPLASTPLPLPDLALTTDPHAEEAEFHTSLQQPWPIGLLRSWEREPEPDRVRKVGSGSEMPPTGPAPRLALSWFGGWDFLPGSTRPGHNGSYQSPSGDQNHGGRPPLSCGFSRPFLCESLLPRKLLFWSFPRWKPFPQLPTLCHFGSAAFHFSSFGSKST